MSEDNDKTAPVDENALREAAEAEDRETLYMRAIIAVSDGISVELGPNIRKEFFDIFGADLAASVFLFLLETRLSIQNDNEREVYTEAFLRSVAATVGKLGVRLARGRVIPSAVEAAEATVKMLTTTKEVIAKAQEKIAAQSYAARQADAVRAFTAPSVAASPGNKVSDGVASLLRTIGS